MCSTVALKWNRKIRCGNSCRRINLPLCLVWERRSHTSFFSNTSLPASHNFLTNVSSARNEMFFIDRCCAVSNNFFFILLYSISKDALPRYSRVSYKKLNENLVTDSLQTSRLPLRRGEVIWSFAMPLWCNKHLPGQSASIIIAFEFFRMFVSTCSRVPPAFFGGRESCACFRSNIPFLTFSLFSMVKWLR